MLNLDRDPLGFSDLNDDEIFVVSIFRCWQSPADDVRSAKTHLLANGRDHLCDNIHSLVSVFEASHVDSRRSNRNRSSVLTLAEEDLLDEIGSDNSTPTQGIAVLRQILAEAGAKIRPAAAIPRSGYDYLFEVINRKSTQAFEAIYPGFRRASG